MKRATDTIETQSTAAPFCDIMKMLELDLVLLEFTTILFWLETLP